LDTCAPNTLFTTLILYLQITKIRISNI
jgi:hypothetical protein